MKPKIHYLVKAGTIALMMTGVTFAQPDDFSSDKRVRPLLADSFQCADRHCSCD